MSVAAPVNPATDSDPEGPQRFIFHHVDWQFYEEVCRQLEGRHAFVTFYKGTLEVVTTSMLHEVLSNLLSIMVGVLAEELDIPLLGAGRTTLKREDLNDGLEPDVSFYIRHHAHMTGKEKIDLPTDPPPDLAIEVEVTRRLGVRRSIYQEMGVPEIWVYSPSQGLRVLLRQSDGTYLPASASLAFPLLSLVEMTAGIKNGQSQDNTAFTKAFRQQVRAALASSRGVE